MDHYFRKVILEDPVKANFIDLSDLVLFLTSSKRTQDWWLISQNVEEEGEVDEGEKNKESQDLATVSDTSGLLWCQNIYDHICC